MRNILFAIATMLFFSMNAWGQNIGNVLSAIENHQLLTLPNGFRIQIVSTPEYQHCNCRLSADVSAIGEGQRPGIKQVVAAMTGSDLVANELIVKNMISHHQALDSLMGFLSEVVYGNNPTYVDFNEYKAKRVRYLHSSRRDLDNIADNAIGLRPVTADDLERISNADYMNFRKLCFSPDKCLLTIVSDVDAAEIKALAEKHFGSAEKTSVKGKISAPKIKPLDEVQLINDTTAQRFETVFKHYYACDKTAKNYLLNMVGYQILNGSFMTESGNLSCFKYDVNSMATERGYDSFEDYALKLYGPRNPEANYSEALQWAKNNVISEFNKKLKAPDYAAEVASDIVWYKFPKNFFSMFENSINAVGVEEISNFLHNIIKNGSQILVIRARQKDIHCLLMDIAKDRDVCILNDSNAVDIRIPKGFGAKYVLQRYLKVTGLETVPKSVFVTFKSLYDYPDGNQYMAGGKVMRKNPNMYRMDNFIVHEDSVRLFHFKEIYDGLVGVDSTMLYGMTIADSARNIALMQKATFPLEAHYDDLGIEYELFCNYDLFRKGVYKLWVKDLNGREFHDYYSVRTGLLDKTEILGGSKVAKTIFYEFEKHGKYAMPHKIKEFSDELTIEIVFSPYEFDRPFKKTDFQIIMNDKKKK